MNLALRRSVWLDGEKRPNDYTVFCDDQKVGRIYQMRTPIFDCASKKISPAKRSPRLCIAPFAGHPFGGVGCSRVLTGSAAAPISN
jgi:hypothetical protein